mmetsp:Transcript_6274/g.17544  ORF Transcript_6274/g.17544 Transcript_6274/m.17544 type:complete len:286 (+) Transcript_6274:3230-4087(+)
MARTDAVMGTAGLVGTFPVKSSGVISAVSGPYGSTTGIVSRGDVDADADADADDDAAPQPPLGIVAVAAANTEAASPPPPAARAKPGGGFRPGPLRLSSTVRVSNCTARDCGIIPQELRAELVRIPDRYWFDTAAMEPGLPAPPPFSASLPPPSEDALAVPRGSRNRSLRPLGPSRLPSALAAAGLTRLGSQRPSAQAYCPTCRSQNEMDRMVPSMTVFPTPVLAAAAFSSLFFFFAASSPSVSLATAKAASSSSSITRSRRHSSALIQAATSTTLKTLMMESRA